MTKETLEEIKIFGSFIQLEVVSMQGGIDTLIYLRKDSIYHIEPYTGIVKNYKQETINIVDGTLFSIDKIRSHFDRETGNYSCLSTPYITRHNCLDMLKSLSENE